MGWIILVVQIFSFLFLFVSLCLLRSPLKYKLKQELLALSLGFIVSRLLSLEMTFRYNCFYDSATLFQMPELYLFNCINVVMFTFLVPYPLCANRAAQQ